MSTQFSNGIFSYRVKMHISTPISNDTFWYGVKVKISIPISNGTFSYKVKRLIPTILKWYILLQSRGTSLHYSDSNRFRPFSGLKLCEYTRLNTENMIYQRILNQWTNLIICKAFHVCLVFGLCTQLLAMSSDTVKNHCVYLPIMVCMNVQFKYCVVSCDHNNSI